MTGGPFVVALVELRAAVELEAGPLAADLGVTAYEAGLLLRGAAPVILLRTPDRARATDLLARIRGRGHAAVAFDAAAVVASEAMTTPRDLRIEEAAFASGSERLPFADVLVTVRAVHQTRAATTTTTTEKQTSLARAALSGGLVRSKTVQKQVETRSEQRELVAYVFRASGAAPWLLVATRLRYEALGGRLAPSQHENFETLLAMLRERAPHASLDLRLIAHRGGAETLRAGPRAGDQRGSSASQVDLLAHVVALAIHKGG
jgi:hypothetical protein